MSQPYRNIAAGGALIAALAAALPAAAQTAEQALSTVFRFIDRNGDGFIDRGEFRRARAIQFERMDRDRDGKVTEAEFTSKLAGNRPRLAGANGLPERDPAAFDAAAAEAYRELDRDGDGVVDRDEFVAAGEPRFAAADRDKDERISRGEWAGLAAAVNGGARHRP